jgi:multidrug resistance efflux pump
MLARTIVLLSAIGAAALVLTGCASAPSMALERARVAVAAAHADPSVARHAPAELLRATEALAHADSVWRKTHDEAQTNHLAYMAALQAEAAARTARSRLVAAGARPADPEGVDRISLRVGAQAPAAGR